MSGAITNDSKVTVSLTVRQWIGVVAALLLCAFYVWRIEVGRRDAADFKAAQLQWNEQRGGRIKSHEWRLARVERRLGFRTPRRSRPVEDEGESWFWQN